MTPIVVSSLEISIPDEPSVAGMTFSSSCLSPYCSDAVAGPSNVGSVGGAKVMAPVCSAALVVATAASAVWVTSGIRVLASRSCRDYFDLARREVARARIVDALSSHEVTGPGKLFDPREVVDPGPKPRGPRCTQGE